MICIVDTGLVTKPGRVGADVRPFRAWVLDPGRLRHLANRHATPWDGPDHRGTSKAVDVLGEWKRNGVVLQEPHPAWYAYEQTGPRGTQRGLLCAVHLDSRLLPHEDIIPGQIEEMVDVMHATDMNLPPALMAYSGDGRTSSHLAKVTRKPPIASLFTTDGQEHRIWRFAGSQARADIIGELAEHPAFIADGHHRYAAARHVRRGLYAEGYGHGPWDYMLSLFVDVRQFPLQLRPVHRVLPNLDPFQALSAAAEHFRVTPLNGALEEWLDTLRAWANQGPAFVAVTAQGGYLLAEPDHYFLNRAVGRRPAALRELQVTALQGLIDTAWRVPDSPGDRRYESSVRAAVQSTHTDGGIAVLMTSPTQGDLRAAAAAGVRLPCKTTSFGPKPHPGLVLRDIEIPEQRNVHMR